MVLIVRGLREACQREESITTAFNNNQANLVNICMCCFKAYYIAIHVLQLERRGGKKEGEKKRALHFLNCWNKEWAEHQKEKKKRKRNPPKFNKHKRE